MRNNFRTIWKFQLFENDIINRLIIISCDSFINNLLISFAFVRRALIFILNT